MGLAPYEIQICATSGKRIVATSIARVCFMLAHLMVYLFSLINCYGDEHNITKASGSEISLYTFYVLRLFFSTAALASVGNTLYRRKLLVEMARLLDRLDTIICREESQRIYRKLYMLTQFVVIVFVALQLGFVLVAMKQDKGINQTFSNLFILIMPQVYMGTELVRFIVNIFLVSWNFRVVNRMLRANLLDVLRA